MERRNSCSGRDASAPPPPAARIGRELSELLDRMGYSVLSSSNAPELCDGEGGAGRPAACANLAMAWGADCLFRICVRAASHPSVGAVSAAVHRRDRVSWELAERVLDSVSTGSELKRGEVRRTSGILLLRRVPCAGVLLLLELPFRQKESLNEDEVRLYASSIADGIHAWACRIEGSAPRSGCRRGFP